MIGLGSVHATMRTYTTHLALEEAAVVEQLFHGHVRDDGACFTLNNSLNNVLHMVSSRGDGSRGSSADMTVRVACKKHSVLLQRGLVVVRSNCENGRY
jgi:hypothetical protein